MKIKYYYNMKKKRKIICHSIVTMTMINKMKNKIKNKMKKTNYQKLKKCKNHLNVKKLINTIYHFKSIKILN